MRFTDEPLRPFGNVIFEMDIPSQLTCKSPLVFLLLKELTKRGCLPEGPNPRAELVLDEAVTNAIIHGNKRDATRKVSVKAFTDGQRWGVLVQDEGEGFGPEKLPTPEELDDVLRESGRGVMLMEAFADDLTYSRADKCLLLVRRCQREPAEEELVAAPARGAEGEPAPHAVARVSREGGVTLVEIMAARVSQEAFGEIKDVVFEAAAGSVALALDVHRVGFVASIFLRLLVGTHRQFGAGAFIVAGLQPTVYGVLESVGLDRVIEIAPDGETAVRLLKERLASRG